jgi:hypothetical protein
MRKLTENEMSIEEGNPFQTAFLQTELIKAKEEDGKWIIYLEASSESVDQEGEITVMKALQEAKADYLAYGVISWDHQHKLKSDPEFIIGEPIDVAFSANKRTLIKALLYQKNHTAQSVWNNIQSGTTRLGASVGGYILNKSDNLIKKVRWRDTAITDKPVNNDTFGKVSLMPFTEFAKALMAGSGVDASQFSSGRAITPESFQGATNRPRLQTIPINIVELVFTDFLKSIKTGDINTYSDVRNYITDRGFAENIVDELVEFIYDQIINKKQ